MRVQREWGELSEVDANELVGANKYMRIIVVSKNIDRNIDDLDKMYGVGKSFQHITTNLFVDVK